MRTWWGPADTASSTTYWIAGLSTTGSISLGVALVAGRNRVPRPAAGMTALLILGCDWVMAATLSGAFAGNLRLRLIGSHMNTYGRVRVRPVSHIGRATEADKRMLRRELLAVRNRLTADDVRESAQALAGRALELPELAHARTVAAYVSVGSEP